MFRLTMGFILVMLFAPGTVVTGQQVDDSEINPKDFIKDEPTEPKEYAPYQRKAVCRRHEGQYISYAANVYFVENCAAREVQNSELVFTLNRQRKPITPVEADVIARLEVGEPILAGAGDPNQKQRRCQVFNKKYVTFSYADVYYVENCVKRLFPDWESYVEHRKKMKYAPEAPIEALTWEEFGALKPGDDMPSTLDRAFAEALGSQKTVEVIPVDEACKGIEGKYVTFHSRMYFIEKCRKREIDPADFTMRFRTRMPRLVELQADQWYSLPDGKPYRPR